MRRLILTHLFLTASIALAFFFSMGNLTFAETKTFVKEYSYQASEYDSKVSCRALALEQVKRLLLEELGTYLESDTEVKNFQLTKDQIVILTAGIVRAEITEEKWDGKTYFLKAKITADPKDVITSIENLRRDRQKTQELEETRKKADAALREVEKLKRELEIAKAEKPNLSPYNKAINELSAIDWYEKGLAFQNAGNYQQAVEAYTRAIELDPKYVHAFNNRGYAYTDLGVYQQALRDFNRGIQLDPKEARPYYGRGYAYAHLGDYQQALRDFNRGIQLDPKIATGYYNRGVAYYHLGDHGQALKDYNRAIELDPNYASAYINRGIAYGDLGNYPQAIRDYDKAIELDPNDAKAYYNRGIAYANLGDHRKAINDYKTAAKLGNKNAQDYLRSKGISW